MFPVSKTDIAKMAVQMAVAMKSTQIVEQQVVQLTSLDPDGVTVKVGSTVAGHFVAYKLKPFSDKAVDIAISKIKSMKPNKVA
jgi:hypothetical protein